MKVPACYRGNILIEACGNIPSRESLVNTLITLPSPPSTDEVKYPHLALHALEAIEDVFVCTESALSVATTQSVMMRSGYLHRKPGPATSAMIRGVLHPDILKVRPRMLTICGIPGGGKSQTCIRALGQFSQQVYEHKKFPNVAGGLKQIIYIYVEVPPSGRLVDIAKQLMARTDEALGSNFFEADIASTRSNPLDLFNRWLIVARAHFLGMVIFDEVQNLFRIASKKDRKKASDVLELKVVDDLALKSVLNIGNVWKIPTVFCMTPDGLSPFSTRQAVAQRACLDGHVNIPVARNSKDQFVCNRLLPTLEIYQYLPEKLRIDSRVCDELFQLTGYVPRILSALWRHGQRVALDRNARRLDIQHLHMAMDMYLSPLKPAVKALISNDAHALAR